MNNINNTPVLNVSLCKERRRIPNITDGAIFHDKHKLDQLDITELEEIAFKSISEKCRKRHIQMQTEVFYINIYITEEAAALVAVLNICSIWNIPVTLYYYNHKNNTYYPQNVR